MTKNKWHNTKQYEFIVQQKEEIAHTEIQLKNVLKKAKREKAVIRRREEMAFGYHLSNFPVKNTNTTNCYGYIGTNKLDYPDYELYNTTYQQVGASITEKAYPISPSDSYKEFIDLKPDAMIIAKIKALINNKFCRNDKEKIYHKLILSWSISSVLKMVLKKNGLNLHPLLIALGEKQKGKSTAMETYITCMWNTTLLQPDHFEGSKGARLKQVDNTLFPLYCDENISLDRFAEILKNATIRYL
jgi:hypothetical protein